MTTDTYLISSEKFSEYGSLLDDAGLNVTKQDYHDITVQFGQSKGISIEFHQYVISTSLKTGKEITYTITIPHVKFNGVPMKMLSKLKAETEIGLSNIVYQIEQSGQCIMEKTTRDYRNNLLLTSYNSMGIINVMTDKQFIRDLAKPNSVSKLVKDKTHLYKVLSRAFINEMMKYTDFHQIIDFSYMLKFKMDNFNTLNLFSYEKDGEKFVHLTFNLEKFGDIDDRHIRGYNFVM